MCGIAGIYRPGFNKGSEHILRTMNAFMTNRGPDAEGYSIDKDVGLCHKRLRIIDLSPEGDQPFKSSSGNSTIVFNGEIYNFKKLKEQLISEGIEFRTGTDTEVLINGYDHWGIKELLSRAEGMFAFVVHDSKNKKIILCRDRFGKKPLYYYHKENELIFSSDIRSIWAIKKGSLTLNFNALDYYLAELSMPQPYTIWNEIQQVRSASYIEMDLTSGELSEKVYWKLNDSEKIDVSLPEAIEHVESLLTKAILKRTVSDVPLGAFLSAGVDSGLIVALLASNSASRVKTFTVNVEGHEMNEGPLAKKVATRYNTDHTEVSIQPDVISTLPYLIEELGEPFADASVLPTYLITKAIRSEVTVALSGDGGDEIFGGYYDYQFAQLTDEYYRKYQNKYLRKMVTTGSKVLSRFSNSANYGLYDTYASMPDPLKLYRQMGFAPDQLDKVYHQDFKGRESYFGYNYLKETWENSKDTSICDTLFNAFPKTRMLNTYLVKVDRASMMNSLEVRSPFLDHDLVEYAYQLPADIKVHKGIQKYILKKLAEKYIDPDIWSRKKQGFGIPLDEWLRADLKSFVSDILLSETFRNRGFFNNEYVEKILKEHFEGKADHQNRIFLLLNFELWCRHYL